MGENARKRLGAGYSTDRYQERFLAAAEMAKEMVRGAKQMAQSLNSSLSSLHCPGPNFTHRSHNPIQILGSSVNMVDIPYITDWISKQTDVYRADERSAKPGNRTHGAGLESRGIPQQPLRGEVEIRRCFPSAKQLIVTGFHGLTEARKDPAYRRIGRECDLWVPDSIAPVLIARWRGIKNAVRTPGAEIMTAFMERANERGFKSYFYGDSETTLSALREKLERTYPGHKVAGTFSPPFRRLSPEEEQEHIDMINAARPDVLWVGLGLPKQDEWIYRCKDRLRVPVAAGVGAAFGFLAGTTRRAPRCICDAGLEWAYMVLTKPKRTLKRVFIEGADFLWHVLLEEVRPRKKSRIESDS